MSRGSSNRTLSRGIWALLVCVCVSSCATAGPNETTLGAPSATTFLLRNHSQESVCYIFIAAEPATDEARDTEDEPAESWGTDRLGPTEVILPGGSREWDFSPGQYKLKLEDCNHQAIMERHGVAITDEGVVLTFRQRE